MVLVFDLDDTLYPEMEFVHSQFRQVAQMVQRCFGFDSELAYHLMTQELAMHGRGRVFDVMLRFFGIGAQKNIRLCLSVYRRDPACLPLPPGTRSVLKRFRAWPKYIVTEGNPIAQRNKLNALRFSVWVKKAMITGQYGPGHLKPSPYCFLKIAQWEHCPASEIVYVGDNPYKDFHGIKPLGFKTIRVLTGPFRDIQVPKEKDAHLTIQQLMELTPSLCKHLKTL
jgi:putative hydrolase of the HAD superfamily